MKKCIMFGAAGNGERLYSKVKQRYEVLAYTDNNSSKWGAECNGVTIIEPKQILNTDFDVIVITSMPGLESIKKQLIEMGISENNIDDAFVLGPIESRRIFLEKFASFNFGEDVEVAEAGVFEGDFAKWINHYFPDRILHLFDTFEGFDSRDVSKEGSMSRVKAGDYNNTSEELVMTKMEYPDKVIIHRGFFPETAKKINSYFCFVNLDMDLYEPTYEGLKFFADKMVKNGAILVHDYFSTDFYGPRKAVDKFIAEQGRFSLYPIGDGISILITGFNNYVKSVL